jgi:hypothetical protein
VHLAPPVPYQAANGKTYPYYTCQPALQALKACYDKPTCRALVLVDGPPEATGEHARYPALDVVLSALRSVALEVVLDDYRRPGEKEVAALWGEQLQALGRAFETETRQLEKDAFVIRVESA